MVVIRSFGLAGQRRLGFTVDHSWDRQGMYTYRSLHLLTFPSSTPSSSVQHYSTSIFVATILYVPSIHLFHPDSLVNDSVSPFPFLLCSLLRLWRRKAGLLERVSKYDWMWRLVRCSLLLLMIWYDCWDLKFCVCVGDSSVSGCGIENRVGGFGLTLGLMIDGKVIR